MALFYEVCFTLSSCIIGLVAVDGHGYIKGLVYADECGCRWAWLYYLSLQHLLDMIVITIVLIGTISSTFHLIKFTLLMIKRVYFNVSKFYVRYDIIRHNSQSSDACRKET